MRGCGHNSLLRLACASPSSLTGHLSQCNIKENQKCERRREGGDRKGGRGREEGREGGEERKEGREGEREREGGGERACTLMHT